jgi:branched-chain amino acid transport system substrate-binding protein
MRRLPIALIAVGALALSGCSASGTGTTSSSSKEPIVVGSINALSGPATFSEASQAAKAVFDEVNATGGIQGRQIKYEITDDKGDPATASASARQLVGSDGAVALVGSASLLECQVNAPYYQQNDVLSIEGTGVDPKCFSTPNISPVNVGPYLDTQMALTYGSEVLKKQKICVLLENQGPDTPAFRAAISAWSKTTGRRPYRLFDSVPFGASDYTPYVANAKRAGCDTIFANNVQPDALAQIKAAESQGWNDVTFLYLTSTYSVQFAKAAQAVGAGVYVPAEFAPYDDPNTTATKAWRALMTKKGIELTSFGQGGYLAATYFVDVLKSIKGEINRESVTKALRAMKPVTNPMVGTPWVFGTAQSHSSNRAGYPVALLPGKKAWQATGDKPLVIR